MGSWQPKVYTSREVIEDDDLLTLVFVQLLHVRIMTFSSARVMAAVAFCEDLKVHKRTSSWSSKIRVLNCKIATLCSNAMCPMWNAVIAALYDFLAMLSISSTRAEMFSSSSTMFYRFGIRLFVGWTTASVSHSSRSDMTPRARSSSSFMSSWR